MIALFVYKSRILLIVAICALESGYLVHAFSIFTGVHE